MIISTNKHKNKFAPQDWFEEFCMTFKRFGSIVNKHKIDFSVIDWTVPYQYYVDDEKLRKIGNKHNNKLASDYRDRYGASRNPAFVDMMTECYILFVDDCILSIIDDEKILGKVRKILRASDIDTDQDVMELLSKSANDVVNHMIDYTDWYRMTTPKSEWI